MGFKGSVESFSLADVFQNLAMNQQTGTLHVFTATNEEKFVYFQSGQVRYLSHGPNKVLLTPEIFYARGIINIIQMNSARQRVNETHESAGAALIALNHCTEQQVNEIFKLQLEEEIYDLFGWEKANFEFNEGSPQESLFIGQISTGKGPSLPISHLIMEAARRVDEWDRLKKQISSFKEIYCMDLAARKAIESGEMETDPVEKRVASLIDCARDVEDIILDSNLFKFEVLTALSSFLQSSLIRPAAVSELTVAEQECMRSDMPKRRVKVLERILALGGENAKIRRELAESLARDNQIDKACIHYTVLAEAEQQAGREEAALDLYRRVLALSSKHIKAHEQLAAIYAKRGQKREAFVHYQELFETFRDQNHLPQARTAAAAAVDCDPSHIDLRNALIELLLQDNQKDAAGHQLELLGDFAGKNGNVKLAVDAYRRAMHLRPANKNLKKKLNDVMLTKEDRLARKRKAVFAMVFIAVVGLAGAIVAFKEHLNWQAYSVAERSALELQVEASKLEADKKYKEAGGRYSQAAETYLPLAKIFSPVLGFNKKATAQIAQLQEMAKAAENSAVKYREELSRKAELSRENADNAMKAKRVFEAVELYQNVLDNDAASEKARFQAEKGKAEAQAIIDRLKQGKEKVTAAKPDQVFASVEEEYSYKLAFMNEFRGYPDVKVSEIEMPVMVKPNINDVKVYLDTRWFGTVQVGGTREANTFRYSAGEPHKFEFRKDGFKTQVLSTSELRSSIFNLKMERDPALRVDLRSSMPADAYLSGEPLMAGNVLYVGTSDGSLLQINSIATNMSVKEFKAAPTGSLNMEVYGPLNLVKREGKSDLIVFCTKAGDCFGVDTATMKQVWSQKGKGRDLTAKPSVLRLPLLANASILAVPLEKKLLLYDCETGLPVSGGAIDFAAGITSSVTGIDNDSMVLAGCQDGKLRGVSLKTQVAREWTPNPEALSLRSKPVVYDGDIVIAADDGVIYLFKLAKNNFEYRVVLENAGPFVCEPLIVRKRIYAGTVDKDGFWCADLGTRQRLWKVQDNDIGDVRHKPAVLEKAVYFGTDKGRLYSVDAESGAIRWVYQFESNKAIIGSPMVSGKRVYAISRDGKVLGFDE
ncbi:MAG TPA: DUF4388 domain-containing protein [Planctomycetota bacterium]|nr:DUF4388 domain-containing protein [Planctomycetota bacterium]